MQTVDNDGQRKNNVHFSHSRLKYVGSVKTKSMMYIGPTVNNLVDLGTGAEATNVKLCRY